MVALLLVAASLGLSNFAAAVGIGVSGVDARARLWVGVIFGILAVGFALGAFHVNLAVATIVIGVVSVAMSLIGLELGRYLGGRAGERGEILGGLVLIGVGVAIAAGVL